MYEPGLDRHEWQTEWEALEPLLEDSPSEALPELDRLVERMLVESGYPLADEPALEGAEREIVAEFAAARRIAQLVDAAEPVDPGDVAAAVNGYRALYDHLVENRRT